MRKLIAAINMTLDGYCDHTAISPDAEIHDHYTALLHTAGAALYGRVTYQLMQYWQPMLETPTGNRAMDEFAVAIDKVPKIVFSNTLKATGWQTATLAAKPLKEEVLMLKQQPGKDIFACSPGLIVSLTELGLIDEYQLCVHPVIAGSGLPLFKNISNKITLKLVNTKQFSSGAIILYYEPVQAGNAQ
ncbi:MAG: dihydrofolate reductase [Chitinophagaceae bacterium]|nr:dihydrofolate reductase [Chitinophagaceae bacterium]